jgi:hypothetical protein
VAMMACSLPLCFPSSGPHALLAFLGRPSNGRSRARVLACSAADARAPLPLFTDRWTHQRPGSSPTSRPKWRELSFFSPRRESSK